MVNNPESGEGTKNGPTTGTALRAGAARVEITPWAGAQVGGSIGLYRPARLVLEPIWANALVLESGATRLLILSIDVPTIETTWCDRIRAIAAERFGFDRKAVMVHATQTHAAPHIGGGLHTSKRIPDEYAWLRSGEESYSIYALDRIVQAISQAAANAQPARIGVGSGLEARVAFNRRMVMRDGSVRTLNLTNGDPNILYAEGPIDPELGVLTVFNDDLQMISMLLHHTCHPCHGNTDLYVITPGWPGAWSEEMRKICGPGCIPVVINGCCGNIHHRNRLNPDPHHSDDYHRLGRWLAETTVDVLKHRMTYMEDPVLDYRSRYIQIPLREPDPALVAEARRVMEEYPEPMWTDAEHHSVDWKWMFAAARLELADEWERSHVFDFEVQGFRVGNSALIGLGGEPFVQGQLAIKLRSPAYRTFVAHMTNVFAGYIPTKDAFGRGGYETDTGTASKLAPEALDMIVEASVGVLQDLFPGQEPKAPPSKRLP